MNKVPKSHLLAGKLFDRRKFLDGSAKVYYGPGQGPEVIANYTAPTDWNPAGSLLQMPQIVWLIVDIPAITTLADNKILHQSYITQTFSGEIVVAENQVGPKNTDATIHAIGIYPNSYTTVTQGYNLFVPGNATGDDINKLIMQKFYEDTYTTAYEICAKAADAIDPTITQNHAPQDHQFWAYYPGFAKAYFDNQDLTRQTYLTYYFNGTVTTTAVDISVSDYALIESQKLEALYKQVKTQIETLRPGKTFVQVLNYSFYLIDYNTDKSANPTYPVLPNNNTAIYYVPQILDSSDTFVSGDLLTVVCQNTGAGYIQYALSDLKKTVAKFNKFGFRVIMPYLAYPDYSKYSGQNVVNDMIVSNINYAPFSEGSRISSLVLNNNVVTDVLAMSAGQLDAQLIGNSSNVTVDSLVQTIADFYDFDATTGKQKNPAG